MNKITILCFLLPLLVVGQYLEEVKVGMKALYGQKALEKILEDSSLSISIDESKEGKILMRQFNMTIDAPHQEDIEVHFDEENNAIDVEIKNQEFAFNTLLSIDKQYLKLSGEAEAKGKMDTIKITLGLTTQEGKFTVAPAVKVQKVEVEINKRSWDMQLSNKFLNFLSKPLKLIFRNIAIKYVTKNFKNKLEEIVPQIINDELAEINGRYQITNDVVVDVNAVEPIEIGSQINVPLEVTYYIPEKEGSIEEDCQSDCEADCDSECKPEDESEDGDDIIDQYLNENCFQKNGYVEFWFRRSDLEYPIEDFYEDFKKVASDSIHTFSPEFVNSGIVVREEE